MCQGVFYGNRTRRFGALLRRSPRAEALVRHPVVLEIAEATLLPWCERIALNLTQAVDRKSTRLDSSHLCAPRMPSAASHKKYPIRMYNIRTCHTYILHSST